jgi:hypothetical protein
MLTPYLTLKFRGTVEYGKMSLVFAIIPFLYTLILFAFETAYFRFMQRREYASDVYNTLCTSLLLSTLGITGLTIVFNVPIAHFIGLANHPEYITLSAFIIGFDALSALPFARLRYENRPIKFAAIRVAGILINIATVYFFLSVCPEVIRKNPNTVLRLVYSPSFGAGYVLIANVTDSICRHDQRNLRPGNAGEMVALKRRCRHLRGRGLQRLLQIIHFDYPVCAGFPDGRRAFFLQAVHGRQCPESVCAGDEVFRDHDLFDVPAGIPVSGRLENIYPG